MWTKPVAGTPSSDTVAEIMAHGTKLIDRRGRGGQPRAPSAPMTKIIAEKKAFVLAVHVNGASTSEWIDSLLSMTFDSSKAESLSQVLRGWPSAEENALLASFSGDVDSLGPVSLCF